MEQAWGSIQRMSFASGFCRLILLLMFSICVGALRSGHSPLRSRRLLVAVAGLTSNNAGSSNPFTPPLPSGPFPASPPPPPSQPPPPRLPDSLAAPNAATNGSPPPTSTSPPLPSTSPPPTPASPPPTPASPPPTPASPPSTPTSPPSLPGSPDQPGPPTSSLQLPLPPSPLTPGSAWNGSEKAGVAIAVIAALLQVAVVAFLLIKRHQMMTTVELEDYDDNYDHADAGYRFPGHSA